MEIYGATFSALVLMTVLIKLLTIIYFSISLYIGKHKPLIGKMQLNTFFLEKKIWINQLCIDANLILPVFLIIIICIPFDRSNIQKCFPLYFREKIVIEYCYLYCSLYFYFKWSFIYDVCEEGEGGYEILVADGLWGRVTLTTLFTSTHTNNKYFFSYYIKFANICLGSIIALLPS